MSSPMMNRMLGFCGCGCAKAGASVATMAAHGTAKPSQVDLLVLITVLLQVSCRATPGSDVVAAREVHGRRPPWTSTASLTERLPPDLFQTASRNAIVLKGRSCGMGGFACARR